MLELLVAVGTGVSGDLLAVDAQREIHLIQETSDSIGRDRNVDLLKTSAIFAVVLRVHFNPVMGSPAVSCSRRISMASIISGVFFHQLAPAASSARAVHFHILS
jgi:hypothetical protein